jgi:hypothetical protein
MDGVDLFIKRAFDNLYGKGSKLLIIAYCFQSIGDKV